MLNNQYNKNQNLISKGSYKLQETTHFVHNQQKNNKINFNSAQNKGFSLIYAAKVDKQIRGNQNFENFSQTKKSIYINRICKSKVQIDEEQQSNQKQNLSYQAKNLMINQDRKDLPELMSEQETNFQTENESFYESQKSNSPKNSTQLKHQSQIVISNKQLTFENLKPEFRQQDQKWNDSLSFKFQNFESLQHSNFEVNQSKFECSVSKQEPKYFKNINDNSFEIALSDNDGNLSNGFQDGDYLTAVNDNQSTLQLTQAIKLGGNCDSLSATGILLNQKDFQTSQSIQMNNESADISRRESFEMPVFSENQNESVQQFSYTYSSSPIQNNTEKLQIPDQDKTLNQNFKQPSKFKLDAIPFYVKNNKINQITQTQKSEQNQKAINQEQNKIGSVISQTLEQDLFSLTFNNDFTPSTPYIHKFRTEMCKNWELYGKCKYGDECSFAHGKVHMMIKKDVSVLYKTKLCRKYSANGYCPYGMRCQFIHDTNENINLNIEKQNKLIQLSTVEQEKKQLEQKQIEAQPFLKSNIKAWTPLIKKIQCVDKKESSSENQHKTVPQNVLNPQSAIFTPSFIPSLPKIVKQPVKQQIQTPKQNIVIGGFGNKQTHEALSDQKNLYSEILVHNIHVSLQEFQKNLKINKKKFNYMNPQFEYVNIYSNTIQRLKCLRNITEHYIINDEENDYLDNCEQFYNIQDY